MKVASFAGYVQESASYHHGEISLCNAITCMAQDFLGANNVNLFTPSGQFGDRNEGGKNSASPRYISTFLTRVARTLFHMDDDKLLEVLEDDGKRIEYKWFVPVVPFSLWNGANAIAMGWSTYVPPHDLQDLVANILRKLDGEAMLPMAPSFRDNTGKVAPGDKPGQYVTFGTISKIVGEIPGVNAVDAAAKKARKGSAAASAAAVDAPALPPAPEGITRYITSELPIGTWTKQYKLFLGDCASGIFCNRDAKSGKVKSQRVEVPRIQSFSAHHIDNSVRFILDSAELHGWYRHFNLYDTLSLNNLVLFDENDRLRKYDSTLEILEAFYPVRLRYYELRKQLLVRDLRIKLKTLECQARFMQLVRKGGGRR
jgi:DNA topoisomerase-2